MLMMAKSDQASGASLIIRAKVVATLCGVSERTIRRWADTGLLPPPVKLPGVRRWRRAEIEAWVEAGCPPGRRAFRRKSL